MKNTLLGLVLLSLFIGCMDQTQVDLNSPTFTVPQNFPKPVYALDRNPITAAGVDLGRMLFFDARLSRDGTIACAECHSQPYAFTHHGHDLSHGIDGKMGNRNSLPIQNLAWSNSFFWDGGVFDLDLVPIAPIENPVEMDETTYNVLNKLRQDKTYPKRFKAAFGSEEITTARFLQALSQYMLTLVSANSRYDKFVRNEGGKLTEVELAGKQLFTQRGAVVATLVSCLAMVSTGITALVFHLGLIWEEDELRRLQKITTSLKYPAYGMLRKHSLTCMMAGFVRLRLYWTTMPKAFRKHQILIRY